MGAKMGYPIKYCVMGLKEFSHYDDASTELEAVKEVYAYVAVKCYLVSETKIYNERGSFKLKYGVVPTWKQDNDKEIVPHVNWNGECINAEIVNYVFNNVEEAKRYARELNYELCEDLLSSCTNARYNEYSKELEYKLQKAYRIEEEHLNNRNR